MNLDPQATSTAALITASVSLFVGVTSALLTLFTARWTSRQTAERELRKLRIEFRMKQLNEFYGPLMSYIDENEIVATRLWTGKPVDWMLLAENHIEESKNNSQDVQIVEMLMENNAKIAEIMRTRSGLMLEDALPNRFKHFLGHQQLLEFVWKGGKREYVPEFAEYPDELNKDVRSTYAQIKADLRMLMEEHSQSAWRRSLDQQTRNVTKGLQLWIGRRRHNRKKQEGTDMPNAEDPSPG